MHSLVLQIWYQFSPFPKFHFFAKNGNSLCFLCSSLGYFTLPCKRKPFSSFFHQFIYFSSVKLFNFSSYENPSACSSFIISHLYKDFCIQILKIYACLIKVELVFYIFILGLEIVFHCLSNPTLDTFFKCQQHLHVTKQLNSKLFSA